MFRAKLRPVDRQSVPGPLVPSHNRVVECPSQSPSRVRAVPAGAAADRPNPEAKPAPAALIRVPALAAVAVVPPSHLPVMARQPARGIPVAGRTGPPRRTHEDPAIDADARPATVPTAQVAGPAPGVGVDPRLADRVARVGARGSNRNSRDTSTRSIAPSASTRRNAGISRAMTAASLRA